MSELQKNERLTLLNKINKLLTRESEKTENFIPGTEYGWSGIQAKTTGRKQNSMEWGSVCVLFLPYFELTYIKFITMSPENKTYIN